MASLEEFWPRFLESETGLEELPPLLIADVNEEILSEGKLNLVMKILEEADICPHRDKDADAPVVRVISHGDFSIGLRLYMWVPKVDDFFLGRFWMLEHVKKRFDKEGVEIPFPYRTLVYKKDLPPSRTGEPVPENPD